MTTASSISSPYPIFTDVDGNPLNDGFVYIGGANQNPETNPIAVYWDSAATIPAVQPIRTSGGYPVRNGTPARIYVNSDYSILIKNKNGTFVYSAPTSTEVISDALIPQLSASKIVSTQPFTGAIQRTQQAINEDRVCVFNFMTEAQIAAVKAGTSTEDLSAAFQQAINTNKRVYAPKGRYRANVVINSKTILEGDGSQSTIIQPYDDNVAIMTYTFTAQQTPSYAFWDYHSEVHGIGFWGKTTQTGVGFTFGTTNPSNYTTNMEYANNVKFFGCRFFNLEKGVQFPFGNIGTEFYSCGFSSNKYGVYTIDCKFPAGSPNTMHAGNKYFYGGEMSGNDVALYIHNGLTDGFGAISLYGTIIEANKIGIYAYIYPRVTVPVLLSSVWFEANGQSQGGTSTIDAWTGAVRSDQVVTNKSIIVDGTGGKINVHSGMVVDVHLRGTDIEFTGTDCRAESAIGFGGGTFVVDNPDNSYIRLVNPTSDAGWSSPTYAVQVEGRMRDRGMIANPVGRSSSRFFNTPSRVPGVGSYGTSLVTSAPLTQVATTGNGTFSLVGTVVADGRIFPTCNEFTRAAFLPSEYTRLNSPDTAITTSVGWYVCTFDLKVVSGAGVNALVWDRSTSQLIVNARCNTVGKWYTFAAIGYAAGGETLYFDFGGNGGDVTWRASAYQLHRFDTLEQAQDFVASRAYATGSGVVSVASAATISVPTIGDLVTITGTTGITSISATGQAGHRVTLVFTGALTVTDGSNLKLNGNFVTTADDCLTLACDGTNWYEVSRSAN